MNKDEEPSFLRFTFYFSTWQNKNALDFLNQLAEPSREGTTTKHTVSQLQAEIFIVWSL